MKKYKIPVEWTVSDFLEVNANSLEEAILIVKNNNDYIPLGLEPEYIDGTYTIDDGGINCLYGEVSDEDIRTTAEYIRDIFDNEEEVEDEELLLGKGIYVNNSFINANTYKGGKQ